jgi:hypothetical protein
MSDETLRWKLFPFSLEGKAKIWYSRTAPSKEGSWEALCSSFCLDFFPISKIICLCLEILSFTQKDNESLVAAWERFDHLVHSGPSLSIPDLVLLQHFYIGLDGKTSFLNLASNGSILHTSAPATRELLLKIAQSTPEAEPIEFLEEKESQIVEPEILPNPSTSAISNPDEEETPVSEIFNFEDEYFIEFGDTSKYHTVGKPRNSKLLEKPLDMTDKAFYQ